jgi:hypothetical protein
MRIIDRPRSSRPLRARIGALAGGSLAALAVVAGPAHAGADHSTSPAFTIPPPAPPKVVGLSTLVRTDNGVSATVDTSALTPGDVVTLWWIVANSPEECQAGLPGLSRCGPADHLAGRGDMSVHHAAGRIAAEDGTASYGAHLRVGDLSRALFEGEPGLVDPRGAEVILVLKTHGPKIPGLTAEMLHTFAGGCHDQTLPPPLIARPEMLGTAGPNDCAEIQVTVHSPKS